MKFSWPTVGAIVTAAAILFLLYAPIVPFERLEDVQVPSSPSVCATSTSVQCIESLSFKKIWVRSYGSLTYDAFGVGTAAFASPVAITINGVTTIFVFNGTAFEERVMYPSFIKGEPIPLIEIGTVSISAIAFGGNVLTIGFLNRGENETVQVNIAVEGSATQRMLRLDAGGSAIQNFTSWTISPPRIGDGVKLVLIGSVCYGKACFIYQRNTIARVSSLSQ